MPNRYALALAVIALMTLTGCTLWGSVTLGPPPSVAIHYSGPDLVKTTAPTPTPEIVQWTPIPINTPTPTAIPCTVSATTPKNVRSSVWGAIIGTLPANTPTRVLSSVRDSAGRLWYEIEQPAGWVAGWVVQAGPGC